jgi:hypothetical protein
MAAVTSRSRMIAVIRWRSFIAIVIATEKWKLAAMRGQESFGNELV